MNSVWTFFDAIPEATVAVTVYLLGSIIALCCWYRLATYLPKILGGLSWILLFAILLTPTVSDGNNAFIAPAIFGVIFGVLTKDSPLILINLSLILFVVGLGCVLGYLWSKYSANKNERELAKNSSPL